MNEILKMFLTFILGAGGLALIDFLRERWRFGAQRKAEKEDKLEIKTDKVDRLTGIVEDMAGRQEKTDTQIEALRQALKCVLLDRVIWLGQKYIDAGTIDFDDRRRLREMHSAYHNGLGGNGDADAIMKAIDELPLKNLKG